MKIDAIKADINAKSEEAVFRSMQEIHDVMNKNLQAFYAEYAPVEYVRTGQLGNSLFQQYAGLYARVYFDAVMQYANPVKGQSGQWHNAYWSAEKVLETAMHGSHGGFTSGTAIWDTSIAMLGNINGLVIKNLIAAGL